jgi:nucleotide-binding universal stress UspA family protein
LARAWGGELLLGRITPSLEEIARAGIVSLSLLTQYQVEDRLIERQLAPRVTGLQTTRLRARFRLHRGLPAEEILTSETQEEVALIAMGTHGRTRGQQF